MICLTSSCLCCHSDSCSSLHSFPVSFEPWPRRNTSSLNLLLVKYLIVAMRKVTNNKVSSRSWDETLMKGRGALTKGATCVPPPLFLPWHRKSSVCSWEEAWYKYLTMVAPGLDFLIPDLWEVNSSSLVMQPVAGCGSSTGINSIFLSWLFSSVGWRNEMFGREFFFREGVWTCFLFSSYIIYSKFNLANSN